jgi:hypothetical protein
MIALDTSVVDPSINFLNTVFKNMRFFFKLMNALPRRTCFSHPFWCNLDAKFNKMTSLELLPNNNLCVVFHKEIHVHQWMNKLTLTKFQKRKFRSKDTCFANLTYYTKILKFNLQYIESIMKNYWTFHFQFL